MIFENQNKQDPISDKLCMSFAQTGDLSHVYEQPDPPSVDKLLSIKDERGNSTFHIALRENDMHNFVGKVPLDKRCSFDSLLADKNEGGVSVVDHALKMGEGVTLLSLVHPKEQDAALKQMLQGKEASGLYNGEASIDALKVAEGVSLAGLARYRQAAPDIWKKNGLVKRIDEVIVPKRQKAQYEFAKKVRPLAKNDEELPLSDREKAQLAHAKKMRPIR